MHRCHFLGVRLVHQTHAPREKRDPNSRSTLHHSIGPRGTRIPPSAAILASLAAGTTARNCRGSAQDEQRYGSARPAHARVPMLAIRTNRLKPHYDRLVPSHYVIGYVVFQLWPTTFFRLGQIDDRRWVIRPKMQIHATTDHILTRHKRNLAVSCCFVYKNLGQICVLPRSRKAAPGVRHRIDKLGRRDWLCPGDGRLPGL
jgi:hypothetical protein